MTMRATWSHWAWSALLWALPAAGLAQDVYIGRLTTAVTDLQLNTGASFPSNSYGGDYIVFVSSSSNLGVPSNGVLNVYRYELATDTYTVAMAGLGNGNSFAPVVSAGGGAIAFESLATNLGGGGNFVDVFYSEAFALPQGEIGFNTFLVSRGLGGAAPNGEARVPSISGDGNFIAFYSDSSNLVAGDGNGSPDIFVYNTGNGALSRVSLDNSGAQINGPSRLPSTQSISFDGRYVVFAVDTPVSIDGSNPNTLEDVFVRDRSLGTTSLVSRASGASGVAGGNSSDSGAISPNGRYVAFRSFATNLVAAPSGSRIYLRDRQTLETSNMPLPPGAASCEDPRVSDLGDILAQCNMNSGFAQAFLYRPADGGGFYPLSSSLANGNGNGASGNYSGISADGNFTVFDSDASDLVPGDTNANPDVFVGIDAEVLNLIFRDGFEG